MPIIRTYGCEECGHYTDVWLEQHQLDDPPPDCPHCAGATRQEFRPIAITGSVSARANALAEKIADEDYGVANLHRDRTDGSTPKVRYKDQGNTMQKSTWGAAPGLLQEAIAIGRQNRVASGGYSGVDTLQAMLKSGEQADLIEVSKKRAMKVW